MAAGLGLIGVSTLTSGRGTFETCGDVCYDVGRVGVSRLIADIAKLTRMTKRTSASSISGHEGNQLFEAIWHRLRLSANDFPIA